MIGRSGLALASETEPSRAWLVLDDRVAALHTTEAGGGYLGGLGVDARLHWSYFVVGLGGDMRTTLFELNAALTAQAGLTTTLGPIRIDAIGLYGARRYWGWGSQFLGSDPGVNATLPMAGGQVSIVYERVVGSRKAIAWHVGAFVGYDDDLQRRSFDYTYVEHPWLNLFGDATDTVVAGHQVVGASYWSVGFTGGVSFAIF